MFYVLYPTLYLQLWVYSTVVDPVFPCHASLDHVRNWHAAQANPTSCVSDASRTDIAAMNKLKVCKRIQPKQTKVVGRGTYQSCRPFGALPLTILSARRAPGPDILSSGLSTPFGAVASNSLKSKMRFFFTAALRSPCVHAQCQLRTCTYGSNKLALICIT